jgi:uncharacterized protein (TIGR03083 family)
MPLPRTEVLAGVPEEVQRFEDLIRPLDHAAWTTPTRCEGWVVADVASHVTGTLADIAAGRFAELAAPDSPARQVAERRGRSPEEVADELHAAGKTSADLAATFDDAAWNGPAPADIPGTLGEGAEAIWYDTYVHGEDIRAALGHPPTHGAGLRAAVSHLVDLLSREGWGPATLVLDGMAELAVSGGGGIRVDGDPLTFVLVATGRVDPGLLGLDGTVNVYR